MEGKRNRKVRVGTVVSDKMEKTVVVRVDRLVQHSRFKRIVRRSTKFKAHDEENRCKVGDLVKIMETRPLSKEKRWRVMEIISHEAAEILPEQGRSEP
ncbi:MAG: 30S ribosomal protein S17 [Candidatus Tectomicrobia bacterium]|nr:30S ribosomal protein S17 [Candidatus Tectomicrobia bacterium]